MELNIEQVLQSKKPGMSPLISRPLVAYLKKITHQDEINSYLRDFSHLTPIEFVRATLGRMNITFTAHGLEKLDPAGRYLFASNHPFGGLDGLIIADQIEQSFGSVKLIVNDLLMNLTPIAPLFVPINKHGRQSSEYANAFKNTLASSTPLVTFPAGLCSRRIKGSVTDLEWKPSFVKNAIANNRTIVPVYFDGKLSNFFYRLYSLRTALGVKANIEMLYLVNEMFKQKNTHFNFYFGEPLTPQTLSESETPSKWCKTIRLNAYNLEKMGEI